MAYLKFGKYDENETILWSKPSDAPAKQLVEVSRFLGRLLRKAGRNDDTGPEVYQEKCAKEFDQDFDSIAWDDWFDNEIESNSRQFKAGLTSCRRLWKSPADACNDDLAAVRNHLGNLLKQARPGNDTDTEVYQNKCADEFHQVFDSKAWDDWFDQQREHLENSGHARAVKSRMTRARSSQNIWKTPAQMPVSDLATVLKYLGELVSKAGHNDHVETYVYQEKCAKRFNQDFDNDAWDDWFDETIEYLVEQEDESGMESLIYPESFISPVWHSPEDASTLGRAQIKSYLKTLIEKAGRGRKDSVDAEVYQEKCVEEFDQEFDSHDWDDWFDKEIKLLKRKRKRSRGASVILYDVGSPVGS